MGEAPTRRGDSNLAQRQLTMAYCLNPNCPQPQNPSAAAYCSTCGTPLTLAGCYRLISPLGKGGFGRTFLAQVLPVASQATASETSGSLVSQTAPAASLCVVKQIYGGSIAGEAGFQSEAERLRQLGKHPQIPALLAAIENEWGQFLVQEFAPGDNLAQQVESAGAWTEAQVRSLLTALIPVLQHVHSFDIIHRDIKPANIILKSEEPNSASQNLPMLVDFGAAKWIRHTPAETVIGSAGYASPEQSMGQATFASDIYSLGLTCLNLLTSIHPFSLYSAAEDRWVWRDYLPQSIEPRFAQVLDQMVARSLQQRYESMDQVALDLQFSRNPLIYAPKQLLNRATEAIPPLKTLFKAKKTRVIARPVVSTQQNWRRRDRLTHSIGVTQAIAISPQSPIFATGGADGSLRLWHLPSAQLIHTFQRRRLIGDGHTATITALHFHPDGRALYSASVDGTLKEWDSAERCLLNTLPTAGWVPTDLAIPPDGTQLISPNSDGQIVLWDIDTLLPVAQLAQHQQRVNAVIFSRAGDLLISASDDGTVKLWQYSQGHFQLAETLTLNRKGSGGQKAIALAIHTAVSKQAHQLIVATTAGRVQLYPVNAQLHASPSVEFYQSPSPITALAASADGLLAVGSEDPVLTLWQIETGDCVAQLSHDWGIVAIAFTPDGQTLIAASADEVVSIWQRDS